ncbi:hypothetical protein MKD33_00080, partial [Chromobacterium piscinae]
PQVELAVFDDALSLPA